MISEDIRALVQALKPGHPACWHAGMDAQAVAILRTRLEALEADVAAIEAAAVPAPLQGSVMPRDLAALDGKVISMAEVAARQRSRMRVIPIEGGAA